MKFDFTNSSGETLSGRLEMPATSPRAFALFAHCFTCSKDIIAASAISRTLTESGIAVLRFDFTGLGNSSGDFANSNFSSNVDDLVRACSALAERHQAPEVLIGHSLGGAAVLKAATRLSHVRAVVTIGAPSCVGHVAHLFDGKLDEISRRGEAVVNLAGRPFTIKKQFLDDINEADVLEGIRTFKKALLVLHSPIDNTVAVEHAANIFAAARHPKSFVSLDNADHLLMKRQDAEYTARVIGAWCDRYVTTPEVVSRPAAGSVLVKHRTGFRFTQDIYTQAHHIVADEPPAVKGDHLGMNPYELLLSALGACTSMTIKMYADRKGIDLSEVKVLLKHEKIHAQDCEDCETTAGKVDKISKSIMIDGNNLTDAQRQRILQIAERCPVNLTLQSEVTIHSDHPTLRS